MDRFGGRIVLVTGAASGIGQASALRIAQEGGSVACVDVNLEAAEETAKTIRERGGEATAFACDVSDPDSVKQCMEQVMQRYGRLNALCNIAGILRFDNFLDLAFADWNRVLSVNLTGTFLMCQAVLPHLLKTKGSIVNMASTAAHGAHAWTAAYSASKGGVFSLTKCLAIEFGKQGVRANSISPASVDTPMSQTVQLPEGADQSLLTKILPFDGVMRPPSDVASAVAFLASDEAVHINGEDLRVDGGMMT